MVTARICMLVQTVLRTGLWEGIRGRDQERETAATLEKKREEFAEFKPQPTHALAHPIHP